MKIFATIITLFITGVLFSQNSYYFREPVPAAADRVYSVDASHFGKYRDEKTSAVYEFNADGIFITSINMSSVSKKTVRESPNYSVKNGFIHGVVAGDSLPCVLEKGMYYFGVRNREPLVFAGGSSALTKLNNRTYILNFKEDGVYMPLKISFEGSSMVLSDFDYDPETTAFDFVAIQAPSEGGLQDYIVLEPSVAEFAKINTAKHFVKRSSFEEIRD
ncbi:MAG: hypothetical protein ACI837_001445 [Crocinitomicaceae bacterium]|jgi:hypothetical protein